MGECGVIGNIPPCDGGVHDSSSCSPIRVSHKNKMENEPSQNFSDLHHVPPKEEELNLEDDDE